MARSLRFVALPAIVPVINGAFTCSAGFNDPSGTPSCAGTEASTCSLDTCCDAVTHDCSEYSAVWAAQQAAGEGCAADNKFFDQAKSGSQVLGTQTDADIKAACCTLSTDATCGDWNLMSCSAGKKSKPDATAAPAVPSGGATLGQADYEAACCVAKTCLDYSDAWATEEAAGEGCAADTKFFDLTKLGAIPTGTQTPAAIKAACCKDSSAATCSDWNLMSCSAGKKRGVLSTAAAADSGITLKQATYDATCCVAKTCSDYSAAGADCAADTKVFDFTKLSATPAGATDAEIKTACCIDATTAKCDSWDWSCPSAKTSIVAVASTPAAGDSAGVALTEAKYGTLCCEDAPKTCSDYSGDAWATHADAAKGCAAATVFDQAKLTTVVTAASGTQTNDEIKTACCTAVTAATCGTWDLSCSAGKKTGVLSTAAAADSANTLTQGAYDTKCCVDKTCSDYQTWSSAGCTTTVFDFTKLGDAPAGSTDAEIKTACCIDATIAKCDSWDLSCPTGKKSKPASTTAAAASAGATLDQTEYEAACCETTTCSDHVALLAIPGVECAADTKFFDLAKLAVEVGTPFGEAEIKAACCTDFAAATCSDWNLMSCPTGETVVLSKAAPADPAGGATLGQTDYEAACCVPATCSDASAAWAIKQVAGGGCAADKKFFDKAKLTTAVTASSGNPTDAVINAACCTLSADAQCSDWDMSCPAGKTDKDASTAAPAVPASGATLDQNGYETACCTAVTLATCGAWGAAGKACAPGKKRKPWSTPATADTGTDLSNDGYATACCVAKTCSDYSAAGADCAADTKVFDFTKLSATPAGATDAEIKTACCIDATTAKCDSWDWSCPTGKKSIVEVASTPAAGDSAGVALTETKYGTTCCEDAPKTCSDYSGDAWLTSADATQKCAADAVFDQAKLTDPVEGTQTNAVIQTACCTAAAEAKCGSWDMACPADKVKGDPLTAAPADPAGGVVLTLQKYQETCCVVAIKCADFTEPVTEDDADENVTASPTPAPATDAATTTADKTGIVDGAFSTRLGAAVWLLFPFLLYGRIA